MKLTERILPNGIKLQIVDYPNTKLVSSNVIIGTGSRYENPEIYGISHYLEHLAFKGSKKYPKAGEATRKIENLGGIVNAWTSEEATCYWNILPEEHLDFALEVLTEQISALLLDPAEMDKERGPVIEEIRRAHDDPYGFVGHEIYSLMWPNQPIGNGILGPEENIKRFKKEEVQAYIDKHYVGSNINVCIASSLEPDIIASKVEKYFSTIKSGQRILPEPIVIDQKNSQLSVVYRDIKQAHIMFGYKTFGVDDPRVPALKVMMNILATGMGSLLFEEIREKRSAAYAVDGLSELYSDAGSVFIYAGLNLKKTEEVVKTVKNILKGLMEKPLTDKKIEDAKEFIKGITLYQLDGVERTAYWYTTKGLLNPKSLDPDKYLMELSKVTAADVQSVAKDIFQAENESLLVLGPFKDKEKFVKILAE